VNLKIKEGFEMMIHRGGYERNPSAKQEKISVLKLKI